MRQYQSASGTIEDQDSVARCYALDFETLDAPRQPGAITPADLNAAGVASLALVSRFIALTRQYASASGDLEETAVARQYDVELETLDASVFRLDPAGGIEAELVAAGAATVSMFSGAFASSVMSSVGAGEALVLGASVSQGVLNVAGTAELLGVGADGSVEEVLTIMARVFTEF
jgi:hypothetical protein